MFSSSASAAHTDGAGPSPRARLGNLSAPKHRDEFEVAIICALPLEADAVEALFDKPWPEEVYKYGKASGDPNTYSTGMIGRHNVVLAHMPGVGKGNAAIVAANCRASFRSIKLALVVGICGGVPVGNDKEEILLGDVIISDGIVQFDLGRQFPDRFKPKIDMLDSLGRPNMEIRGLLSKLKGRRGRKRLQDMTSEHLTSLRKEFGDTAQYPSAAEDRLFEPTYRHKHQDPSSCATCAACRRGTDPVCNVAISSTCEQLKCDETKSVLRRRIQEGLLSTHQSDLLKPTVHFGLIASGDSVMKSGEHRDDIVKSQNVIAFEMEGAGVWDNVPCVVIKGVCDYADSHKNKKWQNYAAATAASCMKAFLENWAPAVRLETRVQNTGPWFLVPYARNSAFVGRSSILGKLRKQFGHGQDCPREISHSRAALFGLGGTGKTQIALAYAYWIQDTCPDMSVFWIHASNAQRFRQSFLSIAQECQIPEYRDDSKADALQLVKAWLERKHQRPWLMIIDNADDTEPFFGSALQEQEGPHQRTQNEIVGRYIPECSHGSILVTTRNKETGVRLARGRGVIDVGQMDGEEAAELFRTRLEDTELVADQVSALSSRLENLPLALVQAAAFIQENSITVKNYLKLLEQSDTTLVDLLSKQFETEGRDSETPHAVTARWMISFEQIRRHNPVASDLLSLMSYFDRQGIPKVFLSHYNGQHNHGDNREGREDQANRTLQLEKALGVLKAFSFVTESANENLNVHRLVQLAMRKWLVKDGVAPEFAGKALSIVSHLYPDGSHKNRKICDDYLPHAYAVLNFSKETLDKASLFHRAAEFLIYQGQWNRAEELQEQAVKIRDRLLRAGHPDTLASMNNLASTYSFQGRWDEAEKLGKQVIEIKKSVLGEEHPSTLTSMDNLASTYLYQGRWGEAEKLGKQVIEISKRLGEEHPITLASMHNLASTYREQGRWDEAEKLGKQVIEIKKRVLGEEDPSTLTSMHDLASTYREQGRWDEAEKLGKQVIEMKKRVLGEKHPSTLASIANLAFIWKSQGRRDEAIALLAECVRLRKAKLGMDHRDTTLSINTLRTWAEESHVSYD